MRKHTLVLAAAVVLATALAGAAQAPTLGKNEPVTVSPEDLQQRIDGRSLPLMFIEEPY
jgi:hypothetical protein